MEEHWEVDKILNECNVRHRSRDGRNSIGEKGVLVTTFRNRDISIDRVLIMDDIQSFPLGSDGRAMEFIG